MAEAVNVASSLSLRPPGKRALTTLWLGCNFSANSKPSVAEICKFLDKELCENVPVARGIEEAGFTQLHTHKSILLSTF